METFRFREVHKRASLIQIFLWGMETADGGIASDFVGPIQIFLWGMETDGGPWTICGCHGDSNLPMRNGNRTARPYHWPGCTWIQIFLWGMETAVHLADCRRQLWFKSSYEEWKPARIRPSLLPMYGIQIFLWGMETWNADWATDTHLQDSNLPMRNGNQAAFTASFRCRSDSNLPMSNGNLVCAAGLASHLSIQIFLWGMETAPIHVGGIIVVRFKSSYEEWKR